MRVGSAALLVTAELLTCGVTQVVGALALTCIGIKAIWNATNLAYYTLRSNHASSAIYRENLIGNYRLSCLAATLLVPFLIPTRLYLNINKIGKEALFPFEGIPYKEISAFDHLLDGEKLAKTATEYSLATADGRNLKIHWHPSSFPSKRNGPTVILFSPNRAIKESLLNVNRTSRYSENDFNVINFTYSGYPGNPQDESISEETLTYDAFAIVKFLREECRVPAEHIISDGMSLGATLALTVGQHIQGSHVIIHQPFSKPIDVVTNSAFNILKPLAQDTLDQVLPVGKRFTHPIQISGQELNLKTDGFNNCEKVKHLTGKFFATAAMEDGMMMSSQAREAAKKNGKIDARSLPGSQCQDIVDAYTTTHPEVLTRILYPHPGGHAEHGSHLAALEKLLKDQRKVLPKVAASQIVDSDDSSEDN